MEHICFHLLDNYHNVLLLEPYFLLQYYQIEIDKQDKWSFHFATNVI